MKSIIKTTTVALAIILAGQVTLANCNDLDLADKAKKMRLIGKVKIDRLGSKDEIKESEIDRILRVSKSQNPEEAKAIADTLARKNLVALSRILGLEDEGALALVVQDRENCVKLLGIGEDGETLSDIINIEKDSMTYILDNDIAGKQKIRIQKISKRSLTK